MTEPMVVVVRSVVTFLSLLVFSRILGKTHVAQLTFFDWVTGITIGSIAAEITTDLGVRPWPMYAGLIAWTGMTLLTQFASLKNRWVGKLLDGEPVVVIQNGQVLEGRLRLLRLRIDDLNGMLRSQGVFDLNEVEFAVMEPRGALSILKKSQNLPVTPSDLQIPTQYKGLGIDLVVDGEVQVQNLRRLNLNKDWLKEQLRQQKNIDLKEVFLAVIDSQGKLYVDTHADRAPATDDLSDYPGPN